MSSVFDMKKYKFLKIEKVGFMNSRKSMSMNLVIHDISGMVYRIKVSPNDPVSRIFSEISTDFHKKSVIFKDHLISPMFSFQFHNIKDGDQLFMVNTNINEEKYEFKEKIKEIIPSFRQFLYHKMRYYETFGVLPEHDDLKSALDFFFDNHINIESAKIHDRMFNKIEGTIFCHRKLLNKFINQPSDSIDTCSLSLNHQPVRKKSSDALPRFW